jgi:hypothetical protein
MGGRVAEVGAAQKAARHRRRRPAALGRRAPTLLAPARARCFPPAPDRETMPAVKETTAGEIIAERFVIERHVASGGMGHVYRARDRLSGDLVALKLLRGRAVERPVRFQR